MPGPRKHWLLSLLLSLSFSVAADREGSPTVIGSAYDLGTGHFLYTEYHYCPGGQQRCTVRYMDSRGELIARKLLDFSLSPTAPSLTLIDYRADRKLSVEAGEPEGLVVDAGFDNFVRSIWEDLDAGKTARFPFLVAGFDKPLRMTASRVDPEQCGDRELCLEIKLDSWLLGLLASPIELSYSRDNRRLLRFSGVSNMKGQNGETLNVDIYYSYGDELHLAGPLYQDEAQYTF